MVRQCPRTRRVTIATRLPPLIPFLMRHFDFMPAAPLFVAIWTVTITVHAVVVAVSDVLAGNFLREFHGVMDQVLHLDGEAVPLVMDRGWQ